MIVRPITTSIAGEHVLAVEPALAYPHVDAGWSKRLRLFTGRALDDIALSGEQTSRASKLALLGQTRSPGVVAGLDVAVETLGAVQMLHVMPGIGLLPTGEDVVLGHELRVAWSAFGAIDPAVRAAILMLVPTTTRAFDRFDPDDPCERDESEDAFSDEQLVDGVQLELVPWDPAWLALDANTGRRNQLAHAIYDLERKLPFGEVAPWQVRLDGERTRIGVPIALVGLNAGAIAYVDRHAIARIGGDPPVRTPLVAEAARVAGNPALWQARIHQLVDHLADLRSASGSLPNAIAAELGNLPPAGVIPRDAIDLATPYTNLFFPPTWRVKAIPLPLEQLDTVLSRAAALAPLSTAVSEEILVLVPVPQAVFEPHLLEVENVSGEFTQTIEQLSKERDDFLGRRVYLRNRRDALLRAVDVKDAVAYPSPDPDALETEPTPAEVATNEDAYDVALDGAELRSTALVALRERMGRNPALSGTDRENLPKLGIEAFITDLEQRIKQGDDAVDIGFLRAQSDIYRLRQLMLGNALGTKLATSPALATIAKGDSAATVRDDLATLFTALKETVPPPSSTPTTTAASTPISGHTTMLARPMMMLARTPSALRIATVLSGVTETPQPEAEIRLGPAGITAMAFEAPMVMAAIATDDIREATPIVGAANFRNITVSERLQPPPAPQTRDFALASRHEGAQALAKLDKLGIKVDDIPFYAVKNANGQRETTSFGAIKAGGGGIDVLITGDPSPDKPVEEATYFHDTVTFVEAHIGTLRGLEGRIAQYRSVLADCKAVLAAVRASLARVNARIGVVQDELTERRQAIATTRSLLDEEDRRVKRINLRRTTILAEQVSLLAYVRPRFFAGIVEVPELALDPALLASPVPACLGGHGDTPPELEDMVALLREAPLSWFKLGPPILNHLDRVDLLHGAILTARTRALAVADTGFQTKFASNQLVGRFASALTNVGRAQVDAIAQPRVKVASVDVRNLIGLSWVESRDAAKHLVSLGDIIEGIHRRAKATEQAQALIANVEKVAGCLWTQFGEVLPAIRLAWAEKLDQNDGAHVTINLPALPHWTDVPYQQRKSIELLADWLIDHVDRTVPAAVAWMHDLVRACILLASHAPIDQIIAGSVPTASPAGPGHLVQVAIDPARIRIGMQVTFFKGNDAVAHGIVEDLIGGQARTRIAQAITPELRLDAGARARFALPGSPAAPLVRGAS